MEARATKPKAPVKPAISWPADKVERRSIVSLVPYARNARTHSPEQVKKLAASIQQFGWTIPVLLDEQGGIIAGHGRIMAAKSLGIEEAPCMTARGWSDAQKRAYVIADNNLALDAGWDEALLKLELGDLKALDFDLSFTGFSLPEINDLFGLGDDGGPVYSPKIDPPVYTPKGENPKVSELIDEEKTRALKAEIATVEMPKDIRAFLMKAADRHDRFNFAKIAEFYCHASPEIQRLMEKSALVIIDFKSAIENGYVQLTSDIRALGVDLFEAGANEE